MSEALKFSIAAQLGSLRESMTPNLTWPSPETEFARVVLSDFGVAAHYDFFSKRWDLSAFAGRMHEAPILAAVGFGVSTADGKSQELWAKSAERLATRETFPNDRATFFFRPIELLGIAFGISGCPSVSASVRAWFRTTLQSGERRLGATDYWSFDLSRYSAFLHNVQWRPAHFNEFSLEEVALCLWLRKRSPELATQPHLRTGNEDFSALLLQRCVVENVPSRDIPREAVLYGALHCEAERALLAHTAAARDGRNGVAPSEIIRQICQRFHLIAQQLKNRRAGQAPLLMEDEYDVQYLMHGLLKLHFDDVRPEEWCPSYAGRAARVDFLLKAEQVVVETKMTRKGLDDRKLGEELTLDKAKYRTNKDCRTLVCFVYDPDGYCKNPTALERDLAESGPDFKVVVVVAPKGG